MPISKEKLRGILGRAKDVIDKDVASTSASNRMNESYGDMGGYEPVRSGVDYVDTETDLDYSSAYGSDYDDEYLRESTQAGRNLKEIQYNRASAKSSRMPSAIKESMLKNRIDTSSMGVSESVVDDLGIKPVKKQQNRRMQESVQNVQQFDYSKLKDIITDVISEALSESSLKTIQIGEGKIRLVDNSGRIFVANLEYKGNVNDKKKK